jgi:ribosomal protein S18 acetylase RimI-like enzyme
MAEPAGAPVTIRPIRAGDEAVVLAAGELFDRPPTAARTADFLAKPGHHLLFAFHGDEAVGFASCVEMSHPDKGTELFLYELGVADHAQRSGIGRRLVDAALTLAKDLGCYGAWTITEDDNTAALATYRSAGAEADPTSVTEVWGWRDADGSPAP